MACTVVQGCVHWPPDADRPWSAAAPASWLEAGRIKAGAAITLDALIAGLAEGGNQCSRLLLQVLSQAARQLDAAFVAASASEDGKALQGAGWTSEALVQFSGVQGSDQKMETELVRRLHSFKQSVDSNLPFLSFAPDKSRVGSLALLNCPLVLPDNTGFPAPPAVCALLACCRMWFGLPADSFLCQGPGFQFEIGRF